MLSALAASQLLGQPNVGFAANESGHCAKCIQLTSNDGFVARTSSTPMSLDGRLEPLAVQFPGPITAGHERPVSGVPIFAVAGKSVCDSLCDMHYSEVSAGVLAWSCLGNESMTPSQASFSAQCTWKVGGYAAGLSKVGV